MIQITPHMRILVAVEPIDLRAGIDALVARFNALSHMLLSRGAPALRRNSVSSFQCRIR